MTITTYEDYELAKDRLISALPEQEHRLYKTLKQKLVFREHTKEDKNIRKDPKAYKIALKEYHDAYDSVMAFEEKIGLLPIAKAFAKEMAAKHFKRDIFEMPDEKTL
jgi:hypothetical protein